MTRDATLSIVNFHRGRSPASIGAGRSRKVVAALVSLIALTLSIAGCEGRSNTESVVPMNQNEQLAQLSTKVGLPFPADTKILGIRYDQSGPDGIVFAKLQLEAGQWDAFLATSPFVDEPFEDTKRYVLGPEDGWWDPKTPSLLPTANVNLPGGKVLNLGVDQSDNGVATLYLLYHET